MSRAVTPLLTGTAGGLLRSIYKFPMIGISALIYMLFWLVGMSYMMDAVVFMPTINGVEMPVSVGTSLILLACVALMIEVGKAADAANGGLTDMIFSIVLCIAMWLALFNLAGFASVTWLILTFMQTCDAIGGTIIGIKSSRRDYSGLVG